MSSPGLTKQVTFAARSEPFDSDVDQDVTVHSKHPSPSSSKFKFPTNSSKLDAWQTGPEHNVISPFEEFDYAELLPTAPDGGWGWMVCLGSFTINFILDGTLFSFGILMMALQTDLGHSKPLTACIGSTQMGLHMIMGPVISALLLRYSIRQVTLAGSLICSLGFVASFFAPNIYVLIITYGVIAGVGIGMVFLPAIIIVGVYFNEKRAIATGVATSGSGIGTFCFAYITSELLEVYQWRGTLLILGGIVLNCFVCGMLFRPLHPDTSYLDESPDSSYNAKSKPQDENRFYTASRYHDDTSHPSSQQQTSSGAVSSYLSVRGGVLIYSDQVEAEDIMADYQNNVTCPCFRTSQIRAGNSSGFRNLRNITLRRGVVGHNANEASRVEITASEGNENSLGDVGYQCRTIAHTRGQGDRDVVNIETVKYDRIKTLLASARLFINHQRVEPSHKHDSTTKEIISSNIFMWSNFDGQFLGVRYRVLYDLHHSKYEGRFLGRKYRVLYELDRNENRSSFKKYSASGKLRIKSNPPLCSLAAMKIDHRNYSNIVHRYSRGLAHPIMRKDILYGGSISIENRPEFNRMATFLAALTKRSLEEVKMESRSRRIKRAFNKLCPLRLLENKVFILLLITFTMWTAQSVSMTYLPYMAMSIGIDKSDASFLISIVGVSNLIGRPLAGLIADCCGIPSIWLYVLALSIAAVINFYIPFCDSLLVLQVCSAIFGLCMAVSVSLRTIVLAQQLGIEALTESFGLVAFFQGVAYSINPPLAGKLIDDVKSYNPAFVMAAIMYVVSAVTSLCVGFLSVVTDEDEILYSVNDYTTPDSSGQQSTEALGRDSWHWTRDFLRLSAKRKMKSLPVTTYDDEILINIKAPVLEQKALDERAKILNTPTVSQDKMKVVNVSPIHSSLKQASHRQEPSLGTVRTLSFSSVKYSSALQGASTVLTRDGSQLSTLSYQK